MFSTFPGGSPGFGLLILRTALGITALFRGVLYLSETGDSSVLDWLAGLLIITVGVFILVGFMTPIISTIVFTGGLLSVIWSLTTTSNTLISIEIYAIALAAAIVLLGPGAFSLDARLFGRREIIIPKNSSALND